MAGVARGGTVLLVDDEPLIRDLFGRILGAAGISSDSAANGNEALANLDRRHYDAVVIDMIMPEREGVETILEIRKRWPETFIVAISGGGAVVPGSLLEVARELGADRTLVKPFTPSNLLAVLAEGRPLSTPAA